MDDAALFAFYRAIASGNLDAVARVLDTSESAARAVITTAATRAEADAYFLTAIQHYVYAGDTALHIAAAAYQRATAEQLIAKGASVSARNRRGAEPLHYAADGSPNALHWDPVAQASIIQLLIASGADPNTTDKSGVAALHRAVRTRCTPAVRALAEHGADPRLRNKSGATPLHLAVQNTGRGDSGSDAAKAEQREIIGVLLRHGATPTDTDAKGKTVDDAAVDDVIRALLHAT